MPRAHGQRAAETWKVRREHRDKALAFRTEHRRGWITRDDKFERTVNTAKCEHETLVVLVTKCREEGFDCVPLRLDPGEHSDVRCSRGDVRAQHAASMPTICQKKAGACDVPDFCGFSAPSSCVMESPPLSRGSLSRIRGRKVGTRNKSKGVPNSPHEQRQSELGAAAARRERALQGVAGASRQAACTLRVGSHSRTGYRMRVWQANPN